MLKARDYLKSEVTDPVKEEQNAEQSTKSFHPKLRVRRQYNPNDNNLRLLSLISLYKNYPALINDIKDLLNDVDINYVDKDGDTFLHAAVSEGHQDIVELLLNVPDIDPKIKNNKGDTPLDIAVRSGNQIIIGELQKYSELGSSNQQVSSVEQQPRSDDTLKELQTREPVSIFQEINKAKDQSKKRNLEGLLNKLRSSYSDDLKIGVALKAGDCFFDSVAQGLNELKDKGLVENSERFNVKSLRKDCADYARENNKGETFRKYLKDIKNMAKGTDSPAIWERPEIEGQMISNKYDVVLYFYSTNEENGQKITVTKITPGSDDPEVFIEGENLDQLHIDSNEKVVRIVNYKKHFVPLLSRLEKDIEKAIEVSREEVYGVENKKSYSLIQDIGNFNPEENNDPNISEQAESQAQHPKIAEQQLDPLEGRAKRADNEPGPSSQIGQDSQSSGQQTRTRSKKPRSELIEMFLSEVTKEFDDSFEKLLKEVPSGHPAPSYDEFFIYFFLGSTITIPDRLIAKIGIKSVHFNLNFTDKGSKIIKLLFEINKDPQDRRLVLRTIIADGVKTLSGQYYSNDNIQEIVEKLNLAGDDANSYKVDARIFHITLSKDTGRVLRTSEDQKTKQDLEKALQKIQANVIEGVELQDKAKEFESIELQNKDDSSKFENALENLSKKINAVEEGVKELFKGFIEVCKKNKKHFPKVAGRNKNDHNRYKESRFHGFIYGALVLNFKSKYYLNCYAERSSGRGGGADLVLISRKDEYKNRNLGAVPVIVELKVDQSASTTDVKKEVESNIFSNVRTFSDEAIVACASLWIEKSKTRLGESELIAKRYNIPKVEGLITLLLENLNDSDLDNIIKEELERLHHSIPSMGKINGNPNYLSRLILGEILTNNDKLRKFAFIYKDKEKFTTFLLQRDGVDQIIILNVVESVLIKLEKTVTFNDKVVISDSGYIYQIDIGINPEQTKKFFDEKSSTEKYLQLLQIRKWNFQEYKNEQKYNGELIEFGSVNYVNLNKEVELKVIEDEQLTNNLNEALFPIRELITLVDGNQDWSKISKNKAGNIDKTTKSNLMAVIHGLFIGKQNIAKKSNQIIKVLAKTSLAYKRDLDLAISIASKDRNTYQENEVVAICTSEPDTFIERGLRSLIQKMRAKVQVVSFNVKANSKNDLINIKSKNYDIEHTSIGEEDIIEDFFDAIYEGKVNELVDLLKNRVTSERIKLRKREYNDAFKLTLELEEFEMSDLLLKYAIDDKQKHLMLNGADKNGITLLDNAAENDKWNIVEYLINKGGESDYVLEPYMFRLIEEQKWEKVKFLIDKEVDVNATDGKDMTPLHHAVRDNNAKMVSFLIDKGADVDAEDKGKNTPLHYACRDGNYDIVYLLLDRDAKSISNEDGKEPDYYLDYDNPESEQIRELFEERFSNSDSQNPSSDEESHAPEEYHSSSDEIDSDDSQAYFEHLFNKEPDPDSDLTPSSSDELDIEYDSVRCLSSDSGRKKREAESECLFTWEDVDEFNEEKDKKRDLSKIKIDSERFVSYIKDLPEGKQSQLIQLASEVKIGDSSQGLVSKLIGNQKVMNHLGRVAGMTMHGMMAKNVLADFLNGNYQGAAINVGFIAGGQGFAKVAEAASLKGLKLAEEGKLLVGQSLKAASPFLARGTSAFVVYDLVNQIKAFKNGTEEALVGVVGDSIYLGVDAAEIGVEVAEAFGVLEGVSSVTGPIGATIGAVVFVGTDIYMAVKRVEKIDQIIHLKGDERFVEGLRAFIGIKPEQYIEELMEKKQLYNQLVKQGLGYLKQHSDIQSYVFPTTDKLDSKVLLDRKRTGIRWSRARPDDLNEGRVFCLPQGNDEPAPDYGSYLCENAIGIFANKTGDHTLINLGEGKDYAKGFLNSPNIFVVNNGSKEYYGGNKDDIFVLQAEYIKGHLSGEGGINTLDTTLFALQEEQLNIQLEIGEIADYFRDNWLKICEINKVIGRANKAETITVSCDGCNSNVRLIDGQSGNEEIKDRINIVDDSCSYQMQIVVRPNTVVYNRALKGSFDYLVPLNSSGSAELSFIYGPERFNVNNTFWFAYQAVDIKSIDVKYINVFNRTEHEVKFNFVESNKEFNVTISYSENPAYRLGKSGEIRIGNKGNLYMLESSDKSSEEVIRDYLPVANRVSKMSFFIQSLLSNETVVIGSGNHEVIHSNPAYRSHLVGNGGENVYVIDSETEEVIIHDVDEENSIDTIDLRNVVRQVRGKLSNQDNFQLKVLKSANDLLLEATVVEVKPTEDSSVSKMRKHEYCTVRLKDGVNWYNKTHVIVDNAPMKINLDNNEWSLKPQPLMFERDKEIIVVTNQDIEQGSEIITPRKGGNYKFVRSNDNDLMITNAFDLTITKNDLCTITLSKFYETPRMKTLFIKFADKEIILKEHQEEISTARDVNVVKKEHKDQVYNDVFNPEVMMLSDQPVTHRHRHSRHKEQARHRRSTTSSSTRPTGWINDLFGWVKSSVSGLLSSKPESTKSPISQVDARVDVNGTIMLLDVLVRKFTGKQYIFAVDQSIPLLEARSYALNITNRFEKVLNKTAIKSGISLTNLNFDPVVVQSAIIGKIINGKFSEIAKTLYSFAKEACPEFKQTDKFLDHLKSSLKEEKETVMLQQKVEKPSKDLSQEVSRKVELSKKPNTFLNGTSVVRGISRAIN